MRVVELFGRQPVLEHLPLQAGSTARRCPDITKLRALGFAPKIPLADGLKRTYEWYNEHADLYAAPRQL